MVESVASKKWQETVDIAIGRLEAQTGLALAGLSQMEITFQVRRWIKAKAQGELIEKPFEASRGQKTCGASHSEL